MAQVGGEIGFIPGVDRFPHAKQMDEIVGHRGLRAFASSEPAAGGKAYLLQRGEIVFRLGKAQTESHVRIARADHVGNTEGIALDARIVLTGFGNQGGPVRRRRLLETIGDHDEQESNGPQSQQGEKSDFESAHECWSQPGTLAGDFLYSPVAVEKSTGVVSRRFRLLEPICDKEHNSQASEKCVHQVLLVASALTIGVCRAATRLCTSKKYRERSTSSDPAQAIVRDTPNRGIRRPNTRLPMGMPPRKARL